MNATYAFLVIVGKSQNLRGNLQGNSSLRMSKASVAIHKKKKEKNTLPRTLNQFSQNKCNKVSLAMTILGYCDLDSTKDTHPQTPSAEGGGFKRSKSSPLEFYHLGRGF